MGDTVTAAGEQRFRTVAAVVAGVLAIGAVTVGIAHAYYGGDRSTLVSQGMVSAPIDWVPAGGFTSPSAVNTQQKIVKQNASKPIFIPALPNLGGISPKRLRFQWPVHGYHGIASPFVPRRLLQFH